MTNIKSGLSRLKKEAEFSPQWPNFTAIEVHTHSTLLVTLQTACGMVQMCTHNFMCIESMSWPFEWRVIDGRGRWKAKLLFTSSFAKFNVCHSFPLYGTYITYCCFYLYSVARATEWFDLRLSVTYS